MGAVGLKSRTFNFNNADGMPIHLNDSDFGDNLFGVKHELDPYAFKTSAEKENIGSDGLSFDSSIMDFSGRSVSAPSPTME